MWTSGSTEHKKERKQMPFEPLKAYVLCMRKHLHSEYHWRERIRERERAKICGNKSTNLPYN